MLTKIDIKAHQEEQLAIVKDMLGSIPDEDRDKAFISTVEFVKAVMDKDLHPEQARELAIAISHGMFPADNPTRGLLLKAMMAIVNGLPTQHPEVVCQAANIKARVFAIIEEHEDLEDIETLQNLSIALLKSIGAGVKMKVSRQDLREVVTELMEESVPEHLLSSGKRMAEVLLSV